jgi:hypothetical protein
MAKLFIELDTKGQAQFNKDHGVDPAPSMLEKLSANPSPSAQKIMQLRQQGAFYPDTTNGTGMLAAQAA